MLLLVDKPKGMTSHDVVDFVRKESGERRIGHGGTLDPNATGLLIIGVGRESTRRLGMVAKGMKKRYVAQLVLGEERDSDDVEGKIINTNEDIIPSFNQIKAVITEFVGTIEQIPPSYSAVKIEGRKAYDLARKGEKVEMKPRTVTIYSIELTDYHYPRLVIKCEVSSGTYIRALARDIGRKLGCGAYLAELRRTAIGSYRIENAIELSGLKEYNWRRKNK